MKRSAVLQRVLFPLPEDSEAAELYLRVTRGDVSWSRAAVTLGPDSEVSLATFFGAMPMGYWFAHTDVDRVVLNALIDGDVEVTVWSVGAAGPARVERTELSSGTLRIEIETVADRRWIWFDLRSAAGSVTVRDIAWEADRRDLGTASICITTRDRPLDCLGVLRRLASDPEALTLLDAIFVVDQGETPFSGHRDVARVAEELDGRLRVIRQPNLGGSGGFSRGMREAGVAGSTWAVVLDDDVVLETESLRRMVAFAARTRAPTIVGAQMLRTTERTRLHTWGERVRPLGFGWAPVVAEAVGMDLAGQPIGDTPQLRGVADVDFNGWWMALIPSSVIDRIGLAMPFFIKWDDTEFSLRAASVGAKTVTLPGAALWHMPWTGKDDGLDWQAYFQLRNRLVTALLHAPGRRGRGVIGGTLAQDLNHLVCLQYGALRLRLLALDDALKGPAALRPVADEPARLTAILTESGQERIDDASRIPPIQRHEGRPPSGGRGLLVRAVRVVAHRFTPVRSRDRRVVSLSRPAAKWWSLGLLDAAVVDSATGHGVFVLRRDRREEARLLRAIVVLRWRLWRRWRSLSSSYRRAAASLASTDNWDAAWERCGAAVAPQRLSD